MQMKTILRSALLASAGILMLNSAQAQDFDNRGSIYGGVTHYNFDSRWNLENEQGWILGADIPVAERWALNIERSWLNPKSELLPISTDFDWTRIGPSYLLQNVNGWQPYLGAGIGRNKLNLGNGDSELTWDVGVGVKKFFADNWFGRADYKLVRITDLNTWDNAVSLGIGYAFGSKAAARPVAAAPAAPAPAPQPAPEADTDGDGVVDSRDRCANTPRELAVDANGCPILETSQLSQELLVTFDFDKADIKPEFNARIAEFAEFMKTYSNTQVVIEGHTDSDGSDSHNQALSERRAQAVMNALIRDHGIAANRLSAVGYGESRPIAPNDSAVNKARNRRIMAEVSVEIQEQRRR